MAKNTKTNLCRLYLQLVVGYQYVSWINVISWYCKSHSTKTLSCTFGMEPVPALDRDVNFQGGYVREDSISISEETLQSIEDSDKRLPNQRFKKSSAKPSNQKGGCN